MTIRSWLGVLGLAVALSGCQAVPGDGPFMNGAKKGSTEAFPFDVIDLTPATVIAYRPGSDQPATVERPSARPEPGVSAGDVLRVRIFERYAGGTFPTIDGFADLGTPTVTPAGTIEVPYVGTIKVAGLGLRQIERTIENRLAGKAKEPQVIVELVADRTNTITVSGDVKSPGRVPLSDGVRTTVEAINRAGGVLAPKPLPSAWTEQEAALQAAAEGDASGTPATAGSSGAGSTTTSASGEEQAKPQKLSQFEVVVRRHGEVLLVKQYLELLAGADIAVEKGDEIVVRSSAQVVTVLGAVAIAGNVPLTKPNMTLAETLGTVHALQDLRTNKTGLYVFRLGDIRDNPTARARIFRLDFMQPVSGFVAQQFGMKPKDVIFVANAPLYEYDKVLTVLYRTTIIGGIVTGRSTSGVSF
ncbi:MAG: polysaccharide biosynthesis/export family protein [Alphaproteobacteria bacterium]|nr:polysaccharide biosynthesis/export family protein [Alphaproteobacteria bacterium]